MKMMFLLMLGFGLTAAMLQMDPRSAMADDHGRIRWHEARGLDSHEQALLRDTIRQVLREGGYETGRGLPPGLARRGSLPPGLQRHVNKTGHLPPGLEKKLHHDIVTVLPRTDVRVYGNRLIVLDRQSNAVLDVIEDILVLGQDINRL